MRKKEKKTGSFELSICLTCDTCGDKCDFYPKRLPYRIHKKERRIIKMEIENTLTDCTAKCSKNCMSDVNIVSLLDKNNQGKG